MRPDIVIRGGGLLRDVQMRHPQPTHPQMWGSQLIGQDMEYSKQVVSGNHNQGTRPASAIRNRNIDRPGFRLAGVERVEPETPTEKTAQPEGYKHQKMKIDHD